MSLHICFLVDAVASINCPPALWEIDKYDNSILLRRPKKPEPGQLTSLDQTRNLQSPCLFMIS
jgi:hypothetical protein